MMDYNFVHECGEHIPVSQMTMSDVQDALINGFELVFDGLEPPVPLFSYEQDIKYRLQIELIIRSM